MGSIGAEMDPVGWPSLSLMTASVTWKNHQSEKNVVGRWNLRGEYWVGGLSPFGKSPSKANPSEIRGLTVIPRRPWHFQGQDVVGEEWRWQKSIWWCLTFHLLFLVPPAQGSIPFTCNLPCQQASHTLERGEGAVTASTKSQPTLHSVSPSSPQELLCFP